MKVSLVLEGGGMRGIYTAGVLDSFMENGFRFETVIGVSAGACNALSYISGQKGRSAEMCIRFADDKKYLSMRGLLTRGSVFGFDYMLDEISNHLLPFDFDAFAASDSHLTAVATNVRTGKAAYLPVRDMRADGSKVVASSSIPLFAKMVRIDGERYLDGGVSDSIPVEYARAQGFDRQVVVLTQAPNYRKPPFDMARAAKVRYQRYPNLLDAMMNRYIYYNLSLDIAHKMEQEGTALIIQPQKTPEVSSFSKNKDLLRKLYQTGYEDGMAQAERLLAFCSGCEGFSAQQVHQKSEEE